jgi:hypothetical protein
VNGFFADFVGDKEGFGTRLLESLLPLGPIDPTTPVPGQEPTTFREMVVVGPVGLFADDMRRFSGQTDRQIRFDFPFLEIATVGQTVQVVQPQEPRPDDLSAWLDPLWSGEHPDETRHPIMRSIKPDPVVELRVPWFPVCSKVYDMASVRQWRYQICPDDEYHIVEEMQAYLENLNGPFPCYLVQSLLHMAGYARWHGMEVAKDLIQQAYLVVREQYFPRVATPQSKS